MANKTDAAFEEFCRDPVIQTALAMTHGELNRALLMDAFMHGAKYATQRCAAEHHQPK